MMILLVFGLSGMKVDKKEFEKNYKNGKKGMDFGLSGMKMELRAW